MIPDPKPRARIVNKTAVPDGPQACALTGTHSGLTRVDTFPGDDYTANHDRTGT